MAGPEQLAFRRNFGQQFTISEYNFAAPGRFRHLGGVLTGAAGALQDWSGLWRFAWAHHLDRLREPEKHGISYFDVSGDPLSLAGERASVCLFLRGDLPPLTKTYALGLPPSKALSLENRYMGAPHQWLSWYAQVGCNVSEADVPGATWNVPFPKPYMEDEAAVRARLGATPGAWTVFALASDGTRRARVPHEVKDGRLELTLDTARDPACATSAYELVRGSP